MSQKPGLDFLENRGRRTEVHRESAKIIDPVAKKCRAGLWPAPNHHKHTCHRSAGRWPVGQRPAIRAIPIL